MSLRFVFDETHEPTPPRFTLATQLKKPVTSAIPMHLSADVICPVCGSTTVVESCKVVCRSKLCTYRIIYNCSEY